MRSATARSVYEILSQRWPDLYRIAGHRSALAVRNDVGDDLTREWRVGGMVTAAAATSGNALAADFSDIDIIDIDDLRECLRGPRVQSSLQ
jgi:hypothetical protein